jgi:hypothetical protein
MVSTNFTKETINSENYLKSKQTTDVLLLENGDGLLLESNTDAILLEDITLNSTNFAKSSINSTDYT